MLNFAVTIFAIILCGAVLFFAFRRSKPKISRISFNPKMSIWMDMSKEQRFNFSQTKNINTMRRKGRLLEDIRKEYNDLKSNTEGE